MEASNKHLQGKRKYTAEEKEQLLNNLDIEVAHRARQFETWLADALENFGMHQEGLISRVPRLVRGITMREFAKYHGDVQACLKGIQREKLGGEAEAIDRTTRKRKWVESQEAETKAAEVESTKGAKSARTYNPTTPRKGPPPPNTPGTAQRARPATLKTPGTIRPNQRIPSRAPSPSPFKATQTVKLPAFPRTLPRPLSPSKLSTPTKAATNGKATRPPSTTHFNPSIPSSSLPRWPRKDESMLSVNGSPLANPFKLDLNGWLSRVAEVDSDTEHDTSTSTAGDDARQGRKRTTSIIVRSTSQSSVNGTNGLHSRTNSQTAGPFPSGQPSHSRHNSREPGFVPVRTPAKGSGSSRSLTAVIAVPTQDGHLLEFNPFETSPGEIDALDGISEAAKKQAKQDIARLVMQAVERWKIT